MAEEGRMEIAEAKYKAKESARRAGASMMDEYNQYIKEYPHEAAEKMALDRCNERFGDQLDEIKEACREGTIEQSDIIVKTEITKRIKEQMR